MNKKWLKGFFPFVCVLLIGCVNNNVLEQAFNNKLNDIDTKIEGENNLKLNKNKETQNIVDGNIEQNKNSSNISVSKNDDIVLSKNDVQDKTKNSSDINVNENDESLNKEIVLSKNDLHEKTKNDLNKLLHNLEKENDNGFIKQSYDHLKIGFWNIANYAQKPINIKNDEIDYHAVLKEYILTDVILEMDVDLLVVVEITSSNINGVNRIANLLNSKNKNRNFKAINSYPTFSNREILSNANLAERVAFLYDSNKVNYLESSPKQLKPSESNLFFAKYSEERQENFEIGNENILIYKDKEDCEAKDNYSYVNLCYTRPPAAIQWQDVNHNNTFVTIANHASSPGDNKNQKEKRYNDGKKTYSQLGENEAKEALNIPNAIEYFKNKWKNEKDFFYFADTNIKPQHNFLFQDFQNKKVSSLFPNEINSSKDDKYYTSLGNSLRKYANPYDKGFYQTQYQVSNQKKFDIWHLLDNKIKAYNFPNLNTWNDKKLEYFYYDFLGKGSKDAKDITGSIKSLVSDHAPIQMTLKFN